MRRGLGCLILIAFLALAAWASVRVMSGPGAAKDVVVVVEPGSSVTGAAQMLAREGAITSARGFVSYARIFGSDEPIKPGEYQVKAGMSGPEVLALIQSGRTLQRFVAIPEGWPSIMVHERLMAAPYLTGTVPVPAEGSILPDNYSYVRGETRAAVAKRMQKAMTETLDKLWKARKPTAAVSTPQEAITLAAIVEKETGKPSERRMVAGVYSNRLRIGMKLQADPTVIYPVTKGKPLGRRILKSELANDNGYNTYARAGLPAGPIANPGKASIAAVLDPLPTRNLFFVADGTGGHVFAETNAQHEANVEEWYAIRRARGEM